MPINPSRGSRLSLLHKGLVAAAVFVAIVAAAAKAQAGSVTGTLSVSANTISTCTSVSATAMAFGAYTNGQVLGLAGTTTVTLACGLGAVYTLDANSGGHAASGSLRMADTGGTNFLPYGIYKDLTHLLLFGTGQTGGTTITGTALLASTPITVFGYIAGAQSVAVTNYTDSVTLTLSF